MAGRQSNLGYRSIKNGQIGDADSVTHAARNNTAKRQSYIRSTTFGLETVPARGQSLLCWPPGMIQHLPSGLSFGE